MAESKILLEKKDGIANIKLNDPKSFNALNVSILKEIYSALENCENDDSIRCIILSGEGKMFSSGGNVKEFKGAVENGTAPQLISDITEILHKCIEKILSIPKAVISRLHGGAYGAGLNLALSSDIIIASDDCILDQAFVNVGLSVDAGGTYLIPRIIGTHLAKEFFWLGQISAIKAEELGIINQAVPESELNDAVNTVALKLVDAPPLNIKYVKKLMNQTHLKSPKEQLEDEREIQIKVAGSEDFKEGILAFFEKRKPNYKGR
ncbi:MAG: enoyl-CoA hydratase [Candidatus Lokiarchaeota archaeon]|nr:enoyl-CoA hydratase [Candidatus Lokiarchaeota archaeon]